MRGANRAPFEQRAQGGGARSDRVAPERMDARIERRVGPRAASVERAPVTRRSEQRLGLEQAGEREGSRKLRPVEQREALLRLSASGSSPASASASSAGRALADTISPTPIIAAVIARAARDHPMRRPILGWHHGNHPARACLKSDFARTPDAPCARLPSLSAIMSRVISTEAARPRRRRARGRCCAGGARSAARCARRPASRSRC